MRIFVNPRVPIILSCTHSISLSCHTLLLSYLQSLIQSSSSSSDDPGGATATTAASRLSASLKRVATAWRLAHVNNNNNNNDNDVDDVAYFACSQPSEVRDDRAAGIRRMQNKKKGRGKLYFHTSYCYISFVRIYFLTIQIYSSKPSCCTHGLLDVDGVFVQSLTGSVSSARAVQHGDSPR